MRSVPPERRGGTLSASGAICAIFMVGHPFEGRAATDPPDLRWAPPLKARKPRRLHGDRASMSGFSDGRALSAGRRHAPVLIIFRPEEHTSELKSLLRTSYAA